MTQIESLAASSSSVRLSRRTVPTRWTVACLGLLVLPLLTLLGTRSLFTLPELPPTLSKQSVRYANEAGYSVVLPEVWTHHAYFDRLGNVGSINSVGLQHDSMPSIHVVHNAPIVEMPWIDDLEPSTISFQGRSAALVAGKRVTEFTPFLSNVQQVVQTRSLKSWSPSKTEAFWAIQFSRHGEAFTMYFRASCGSRARIDTTNVPPELMSYFETFEYDPTTRLDESGR